MENFSILFKNPTKLNENQPEYFYDLNLDKIIEQIVSIKPKYNNCGDKSGVSIRLVEFLEKNCCFRL